jgi:DNA-binding CsgD family transcriptional regulator
VAPSWRRIERLQREEKRLAARLEAVRNELRAALAELRNGLNAVNQSLKGSGLTGRERTVLQMVRLGMANKEIGAALCISERTVKFHLASLLRKAGAKSRKEL